MAEYIEREAALDVVNGWREQLIPIYGENDEYVKCLETVAEHLEWIHTAAVRPVVRAHWYWDKDGMDWGIGAWRCSACNTMSPMWWNTDKGSPMHRSGHSYCPICGAYMLEGEE